MYVHPVFFFVALSAWFVVSMGPWGWWLVVWLGMALGLQAFHGGTDMVAWAVYLGVPAALLFTVALVWTVVQDAREWYARLTARGVIRFGIDMALVVAAFGAVGALGGLVH